MKGVKHYKEDGSVHKGTSHKMADGSLHTNKKHTKKSKPLFHASELMAQTAQTAQAAQAAPAASPYRSAYLRKG
mgnify:FL=1